MPFKILTFLILKPRKKISIIASKLNLSITYNREISYKKYFFKGHTFLTQLVNMKNKITKQQVELISKTLLSNFLKAQNLVRLTATTAIGTAALFLTEATNLTSFVTKNNELVTENIMQFF